MLNHPFHMAIRALESLSKSTTLKSGSATVMSFRMQNFHLGKDKAGACFFPSGRHAFRARYH